jgi:hypothetical protein
MKFVAHKPNHREQSAFWQIALFFVFGTAGLFAILAAALFPEFCRASATQGLSAFNARVWWGAALMLLITGVPGFFFLKLANRYADRLLDRWESLSSQDR